jgi:hypothetical protein
MSATVAGTTTTKPPAKRLYKKFANEGVIELQPVMIFFILILIVCIHLEKPMEAEFLRK